MHASLVEEVCLVYPYAQPTGETQEEGQMLNQGIDPLP